MPREECQRCGRPLASELSRRIGFGPICRLLTKTEVAMQRPLFPSHWTYSIDGEPPCVCVIDSNDGGSSVTNDIEHVVLDLIARGVDLTRAPLIYRDSQGLWDEVVVGADGRFASFRSLGGERDKDAAIRRALRRRARGMETPSDAPAAAGGGIERC